MFVVVGHPGGDWLRADNVQLCRVYVANESAHHTGTDSLLPQQRRPDRLQPVRLSQLQAWISHCRSQGTPARLTSWSVSSYQPISSVVSEQLAYMQRI